jgi:NADH-quinone oxidoreductase subunit J
MLSALLANSSGVHLAHFSAWVVFLVGAAMILTGALGVVLLRNPVHCALMLVITLFGIALLFLDQSADFLAAVQVIVYAGAIVILFLFVIMFLGVDQKDSISAEPTKFQRPLAIVLGVVALVEILVLSQVTHWATGTPSQAGALNGPGENVQKLGQLIYTGYLLPFEMTAALLVIAVVGAVVLSRRHTPDLGESSVVVAPGDAGPGPRDEPGPEADVAPDGMPQADAGGAVEAGKTPSDTESRPVRAGSVEQEVLAE